jgi:hypothetical protein
MQIRSILVLLVAAGFCAPVRAALITWGPATTISGASDVSTAGTTYQAINFGPTGTPPVTVNGVTFQPLTVNNSLLVSSTTNGTVTLTETTGPIGGFNGGGSGVGAFAAMSDANYRTLLTSEIQSIAIVSLQLTTSGLTVGNTYQVQVWSNYSSAPVTNKVQITGGPTLDNNDTNATGGLGQFAIGTFVADNSSQMIEMNGVNGTDLFNDFFSPYSVPVINAFQIAVIPEPATLGLVAFGATGLLLRRRR